MEFLVFCVCADDNVNFKYVPKKSEQYRRHVMSWSFARLPSIACSTAQLHKLPTTSMTEYSYFPILLGKITDSETMTPASVPHTLP